MSTGRTQPQAPIHAITPCQAGTRRWASKFKKDGTRYKKPGPKTSPDEGQNKKIREIIEREEKKGYKHIGGGVDDLTEKTIQTPGGKKPYRRADVSFEAPDGTIVHYNVGKVNKNGSPISRERQALEDIKNHAPPSDRNIIFEKYP